MVLSLTVALTATVDVENVPEESSEQLAAASAPRATAHVNVIDERTSTVCEQTTGARDRRNERVRPGARHLAHRRRGSGLQARVGHLASAADGDHAAPVEP